MIRLSPGRAKDGVNSTGRALSHAAAIFMSTLREIFDESAYSRFLRSHKLNSSRDSYAAFRREYEAAKARRPRCC